jgi:hypothetical protein
MGDPKREGISRNTKCAREVSLCVTNPGTIERGHTAKGCFTTAGDLYDEQSIGGMLGRPSRIEDLDDVAARLTGRGYEDQKL